MQQWEYVEIHVASSDPRSSEWGDSTGRHGRMQSPSLRGTEWFSVAPRLNELGAAGWELVGAVPGGSPGSFRLFLKRART